MNGITLTIDDTEVRRLLAGMQERGGNLRPALNVAATKMQQAAFASEAARAQHRQHFRGAECLIRLRRRFAA